MGLSYALSTYSFKHARAHTHTHTHTHLTASDEAFKDYNLTTTSTHATVTSVREQASRLVLIGLQPAQQRGAGGWVAGKRIDC